MTAAIFFEGGSASDLRVRGRAFPVFTNECVHECVCCVFSRVGVRAGVYYYLTGVLLPGVEWAPDR